MIGLTPTLALTAAAIEELGAALGRGPSITELADELGLSRGHAHDHVKRLQERGWLDAPAGQGTRRLVLRRPAPPLPPEGFELTQAGRAYVRRNGSATNGR